MKWIRDLKGVTLIELVISMAILGIVIVAFLGMFTSGYTSIIRSGHRADAAYSSQRDMTNKLISRDSFVENREITYDFGEGVSIKIRVRVIKAETSINGNVSTMKSFIKKP